MNVTHYIDDPCVGVDATLRDGKMIDSNFWKQISAQQMSEAVTDWIMLFDYRVLLSQRANSYLPILTKNSQSVRNVATPHGERVAEILKNAPLQDCSIVEYSINANKVGKEESNNHLSMVIYAHWDTPCTIAEAKQKIASEIITHVYNPIQQLLQTVGACIAPSSYDHFSSICSRAELEELLMYGQGYRFTKGHFNA